MIRKRRAGVVVPLFSLRGQEGIGTIGELPAFAALARDIGFSSVGLLPLQRLYGEETSPYGADSAFALDPMYLELAAMPELQGGVLEREWPEAQRMAWQEIARAPLVLHADVRKLKHEALAIAFAEFERRHWQPGDARAQALSRFIDESPWLRDVALFSALRQAHGGFGWTQWPAELRDRQPEALAQAEREHEIQVRYHCWLQFSLFEQWRNAQQQIEALGVGLYGDVPFGQGTESVEVWVNPSWFRRDVVLGVPPDPFSATGQNWGLPPFDIDAMRASGFRFFRERLRATRSLYDEFRIDHVVGFFRQWLWAGQPPTGSFSPGDEPSQRALGQELLELFREEIDGVPKGPWQGQSAIVAEDLGVIPPWVRSTLSELRLAGYKVIPWEREGRLLDPRQYPELSVATYSTHDTLPIGRWTQEMEPHEREELFRLAAIGPGDDRDAQQLKLFELLFSAGSSRALMLATELVDDDTRINLPATTGGHNWSWRMPARAEQMREDPKLGARFRAIRERLERSGRLGGS